jgi:hypothetical protein
MTSARKIKLKLQQRKPRNPFVAPALQRKAGSHRKGERSERQQAARDLRRVLDSTDR